MGKRPNHATQLECITHWWAHVHSTNPSEIWDLLRHTVQYQLLDNRAIPIPHMEEFQMFTLHTTAMKIPETTALRTMLGQKPLYRFTGQLQRLVVEVTNDCRLKAHTVRSPEDKTITPDWRTVYSDRRDGIKKDLELCIDNCKMEKAERFESHGLRFDMKILSEMVGSKEPPKSIYVIHERYVGTVFMRVTVGADFKQHLYENCCVAFVLSKYKLDGNGTPTFVKEIRGDNFDGVFKKMVSLEWPKRPAPPLFVDKLTPLPEKANEASAFKSLRKKKKDPDQK